MYKISEGVRSTHGRDGAIVLDVNQGLMFNVNPVGSMVIELLERGSTETEVVSVICREFNVSQKMVQGDIREFIESMKQHRLIDSR